MLDDLLDEITLGIGVMLIVFSVAAFRRTRKFIARCHTTDGRITGYTSEDSEEGLYYYSVVGFRDRSGVDHEMRGSSGLQEPPIVGTAVSITYDTASPKNAWVAGTAAPWVIPWLVLLIGVAFVIGGFVVRTEQ